MDAAGNVTSLIRYATTETTSLMQMESAEEVAQAKARREADKPKL
jgi:hypothetical protein